MNPYNIIEKYYSGRNPLYNIILEHSILVKDKAIEIALKNKDLNLNIPFIEEGALLHDIGIFMINSKEIGAFGKEPYICHGLLGRELLEKEGYLRHGLVSERHIGIGISEEEIIERKLPLPKRDMIPITFEEKIISIADLFYSKNGSKFNLEEVKRNLLKNYSKEKIEEFFSPFKF